MAAAMKNAAHFSGRECMRSDKCNALLCGWELSANGHFRSNYLKENLSAMFYGVQPNRFLDLLVHVPALLFSYDAHQEL